MVAPDQAISHTNDRERAIATMVTAFIDDAVTRWVYPDASTYLRLFPQFVDVFGERALTTDSAYAAPEHRGLALWLGPGIEPDRERLQQLMLASYAAMTPQHRAEWDSFGAIQRELHPREPHWYLAMLGVDPYYQGQGLGSALLAHALEAVDQSGLPAYLEATNLDNRRLYERHGFVVVGEIQYGSSPPMYGMRRGPR